MKRLYYCGLVFIVACALFIPARTANGEYYHIVFQAKGDEFVPQILESQVAPVEIDNRVLIPVRNLAEALGFQVQYEDATGKVIIDSDDRRVELTIGSKEAYVNGTKCILDLPAMEIDGRTMVPLRFVGEALDFRVYHTYYINGEPTVYVLPYDIVPAEEVSDLFQRKDQLYQNHPYLEAPWYFTLYLPKNMSTKMGIHLGQTVDEVLKIYGIPEQPHRDTTSYSAKYTGIIYYPAPFTPRSGDYTKIQLTFEEGQLIQYKLVPPAD